MHGAVLLEMVKSHINETYLPHFIDEVEGKSNGPNTLIEGALLNKIKSITSGSPENLIGRKLQMCALPPLPSYIFKTNFEHKSMRNSADAGFRSDQMCLLVLSCQLFMDIPANLESLLWYEQEEISHSRWLTKANGYLRMLLFYSSNLTTVNPRFNGPRFNGLRI